MNKVLFIGYGLDPERREAVSVNTYQLISVLSKLGIDSKIINIGYNISENSEGMKGVKKMILNLINRNNVISDIAGIIKNENIKYIHDTFVLPGASLLFSLPLMKIFPRQIFIKEIQNNAGFSDDLGYENLLRILLNRKSQVQKIIKKYDFVITRNNMIAKNLGITYINPTVNIYSNQNNPFTQEKLRICFLGHPLEKKGIYEFVKLFEIIPDSLKKKLVFNFAFSDIGEKEKVEYLLKKKASEKGINMNTLGTVKPGIFFRKNNVLLLPLKNEFGSSSSLNTVLEAMEARCLVVTTDTKLARAIISDNINGILLKKFTTVEILTVIKKVLEEKIEREKIIKKARSDVLKNYSENNLIGKLKKIYA